MSLAYADIPYTDGADGGVAFNTLTSACPDKTVTADQRIDPFWANIWASGSQAAWLSEDLARRQVDAGIGALPAHLDLDGDRAWAALTRNSVRNRRLNALSALDTWRTCTAEQLAAISGDTDVATGRSKAMTELFAAGLADVGVFTNGLLHTRGTDRAALYRPSRTNNFARRLTPQLTYPEWVSVTGGHPWESGSQFDRHNVLATELGLRVAEWCEIGAVVGEKLSGLNLLAHEGAGFAPAVGLQRAADATLIRTDGMRIAVEMTASTGDSFVRKVRRWAELLSNRRLADTGLVVMFVVAGRPDMQVRAGETLSMVKKTVAAAARDYPGVTHDRTAARMFVADWRTWFPAAGKVAASFFSLQGERPTGPVAARWETAAALDPVDTYYQPRNEDAATAVLNNAALVRSVPYWLREGNPGGSGVGKVAELWPVAIKTAGYRRIPVLEHEGQQTTRVLGAANHAAAEVRPPKRLRIGG